MSTTLTVRDESTAGQTTHSLTLDFLTERITVRELIRSRVFQEVKDYNARAGQANATFRGLVQPTDAEQTLNGFRLRKPRMIDWQRQFDQAIKAFDAGSILIIVNDKQVDSLEEHIEVAVDTDVAFLRLTPLVGG